MYVLHYTRKRFWRFHGREICMYMKQKYVCTVLLLLFSTMTESYHSPWSICNTEYLVLKEIFLWFNVSLHF